MTILFDKFRFKAVYLHLSRYVIARCISPEAFNILKRDMLHFMEQYNIDVKSPLGKFIINLEFDDKERLTDSELSKRLDILTLSQDDRYMFSEIFVMATNKGLRDFSYEPSPEYIRDLDNKIREITINAKKYVSNNIVNGIENPFWGSKRDLIHHRAAIYSIRNGMIRLRNEIQKWFGYSTTN